MDNNQRIHDLILNIAPIDGISIGNWEDKSTWRIDFESAATSDQKIAAQTALESFDPNAYSNQELQSMAFDQADKYVKGFFPGDQKTAILATLIEGNTDTQSVLVWLNKIKQEAKTNFSNPNFSQFGNPPFTYYQIMGVSS